MKATTLLAVLLLVGLGLLVTTKATGAYKPGPSEPTPVLPTPIGADCTGPGLDSYRVCFPPRRTRVAERLFAVRPLDPTRVVPRLTGEPLTRISTDQEFDFNGHLHPRAWYLAYDFGPVPFLQFIPSAPPYAVPSATPTATASPTTWVKVGEEAPQSNFKGVTGPGGMQVVSKVSDFGPYWQLEELVSAHNHVLLLWVDTNDGRAMIVRIGKALRK